MDSPTQRATDHHFKRQASSVPVTLQSALAKEPDADIDRIFRIAEGLSDLPKGTYPCLNPKCGKPCAYPAKGSRGHRPQRFLLARVPSQVRARPNPPRKGGAAVGRTPEASHDHTPKHRLNRETSRQRWALERYQVLGSNSD